MDNFESNQNMDLYFQDMSLLLANLEDLKNNLKGIIDLKEINKDISDSIKTIEIILSFIEPFVNGNKTITSEELKTGKKSLKSLIEKLKNYFQSNEEINNLHKINRLIKSSEDIFKNFFGFNPSSDNLNEDNNNNNLSSTNSFSMEEGPFFTDENSQEKDEYVENEFSLLKDNKLIKSNKNKISSKNSKKFIENCREAVNLAFSNFTIIDSKEYENFPFPNYIMTKLDYLEWILNLESNLENAKNNNNLEEIGGTMGTEFSNYNNIYNKNQNTDEEFVDESYEVGNEVPSPFYKINKKLFYFINIISKEYIKLNKEYLKQISEKISKCLGINNSNLFLIQNSPIDNFVKSLNFKEITLNLNDNYQPISKIEELKSIKYNLLIKEYKKYEINESYFDNRGNFIYPNSRRIGYRGKEPYIPPYDWIGLGLNVLGKYENDNWLEDISKESEWAVAYRGIALKNEKNIKTKLKEFIVTGNLKSANVILKKGLNDSRHWNVIKSGIYMTPYIKIAEKYTQSISFNNKNYKVLLMAKVKISEIHQPKGSPFWLLNDEHIRIYRILFKEIN